MVPKTLFGRIVGSICTLSSVLVIVLPAVVIVENYTRISQYNQRVEKIKFKKFMQPKPESLKLTKLKRR